MVLRGLHPPNPRYVRNLARTYRGGLDSESRPIFAAAEMPVTKDHMPFPASIGERKEHAAVAYSLSREGEVSGKMKSDLSLWSLVTAIVAGDAAGVSHLLAATPPLAGASFQEGATRQSEKPYFLDQIGRYVYAGDTALHIAAAAYQADIVRKLIAAGANVHAKNRMGDQALHAAAVGLPGSPTWNPPAQAATIVCLIEAGADPNAANKSGVAPLHRAVRTRCATAVRTLLDCGADPVRRNKNGSTPMLLAVENTGRGGTGSPEAKAEQQEILRLLERRGSAAEANGDCDVQNT